MITRDSITQLAETLTLGGIGLSAILTLISTTIRPNPTMATIGTLTGCAIAVGYRESTRKGTDQSVLAERDALKVSVHRLEISLDDARNRLERGIKERQDYYEAKLAELRGKLTSDDNLKTKYEEVRKAFDQRATELKAALAECERLRSESATFEGQKQQWKQKFDSIIAQHNQECEQLHNQIAVIERQNIEYKARFDTVDEVAKLRAEKEASELKDAIAHLQKVFDQKMTEYQQLASLYNAMKDEDEAKLRELHGKFKYLSGEGFQEVDQEFKAELSDRDRMLLAASARIKELEAPQLFDEIGEFVRANRLIKALWESEKPICLDASEIVPYSDGTGFDVYFSLRDRRIRGQATIDALNHQGNEFSVLCGCIKDLKFEYDRVNPHRIKTAMVFRKPARTDSKATIDKLWIPADQFAAKVPKLLKKPMTRIMASTGEGKGIFMNLLLAIEANQSALAFVRLHDPMDGSEEDYWNIPKASKGAKQSLKAAKEFIAEFNRRSENGIAHPRTIDIFEEVDILADQDSSLNKSMLVCSKGMRHNGMKAYLSGQSPSAGKKGLEWADFDNFNCVYFGTAIVTAIDKTPALEMKKEALKKEHEKLKDYCDRQNEELGLEGWNEYRVGLIVTGGKAYFFELPNADSIVCDWSKLTQQSTEATEILEPVKSNFDCPKCDSSNTKDRSGRKKLANRLTRYYRVCNDCQHKFETDL